MIGVSERLFSVFADFCIEDSTADSSASSHSNCENVEANKVPPKSPGLAIRLILLGIQEQGNKVRSRITSI